jgi:hypothetical protein
MNATIARPTFDVPLAQSVATAAKDLLEGAGHVAVGSGDASLMEGDAAEKALNALLRRGGGSSRIDLIVLLQASPEVAFSLRVPAQAGADHHRPPAQTGAGSGSRRLSQLVIDGEMVCAPMSFGGTSGVARFDRPAPQVLDTIMGHGLEHHFNITNGDVQDELRMFARWVGLPVLALT